MTGKSRSRRRHAAPDAELLKAYEAIPNAGKPYCAHLYRGASDVIRALAADADPVNLIREYDAELAEEGGLIRRVRSICGRVATDAAELHRNRRSWKDLQLAADALLDAPEAARKENGPVEVLLKLSEFIEAMTLWLDQRPNIRSADRLEEVFLDNDIAEAEIARLIGLWRDLEDFCEYEYTLRQAVLRSRFADLPDEVTDSTMILEAAKHLNRDEQIFVSYLQNNLISALMTKTGDRITMLEEKLQELEIDDDEIDLILDQLGECAEADGRMPPLSPLGKPIRGGFSVGELAGKALKTVHDRFAEDEDAAPLRDALAVLYTGLVEIYETTEEFLDVKADRDPELRDSVKFAIKCTKFLLGVIEPPMRSTNSQTAFDAEAVLAYLRKVLPSGEFGMTAVGFEAVSAKLKVIFSKRQLSRDVESHLLCRDRSYFNRITDNVWPIHRLGVEWALFDGKPDVRAMQALLSDGEASGERLSAKLMPAASKVADAIMRLPVERRTVVSAIMCQNDIMRTFGRMDGTEGFDVVAEAAVAKELLVIYDITSTFLSLVSYCLHKHPNIHEACEEEADDQLQAGE